MRNTKLWIYQLVDKVNCPPWRDRELTFGALALGQSEPSATHNSLIRSYEGLTLETSQLAITPRWPKFTLSTQLINPKLNVDHITAEVPNGTIRA